MLAMVREQGELALARGDRKGAEAAWGRMLDLVMPAPQAAPAPARPGPTRFRDHQTSATRLVGSCRATTEFLFDLLTGEKPRAGS